MSSSVLGIVFALGVSQALPPQVRADTVECLAPEISVHFDGKITNTGKGKSSFYGNVSIALRDQGVSSHVLSLNVINGTIQDDSIFFYQERDLQGHVLSLSATDESDSALQIDSQVFHFIPHCEIKFDTLNNPPAHHFPHNSH
jgi:hypothetical protein